MILVSAMPMQQQTGSTDCGLFSIAAAVHACLGESEFDLSISQEDMRPHLPECFQQQKIAVFPSSKTNVKKSRSKQNLHKYIIYTHILFLSDVRVV